MKKRIKKVLELLPNTSDNEPISELPRITNETVAIHREAVIGGARKYIYPLQHSKHKIVLISTGLLLFLSVGFFIFCALSLYRLKNGSAFMHQVSKVLPFPIARTGTTFIAYENYLFELRHYTHYYTTQQGLDFNTTEGKQQLADFRERALEKVINDSYIKRMAAKGKISVSDKEVDNQINIIRSQNRLGGSDEVFEDVLREFWAWSLNDFRRSLKLEMLNQKLTASLDGGNDSSGSIGIGRITGGHRFFRYSKEVFKRSIKG